MNEKIRELCDRQEITELLHEYCRGLDLMDLNAVGNVFTEDCVVNYGPEERLNSHGAEGLKKDLERMWRYKRSSHHLSNVQITFEDADTAQCVSYVIAWHEKSDDTTGTLWGQYYDTVKRTDDGWRIAKRKQVMNGNDEGFIVNLNRLKRIPAPEGWSWEVTGDSLR